MLDDSTLTNIKFNDVKASVNYIDSESVRTASVALQMTGSNDTKPMSIEVESKLDQVQP